MQEPQNAQRRPKKRSIDESILNISRTSGREVQQFWTNHGNITDKWASIYFLRIKYKTILSIGCTPGQAVQKTVTYTEIKFLNGKNNNQGKKSRIICITNFRFALKLVTWGLQRSSVGSVVWQDKLKKKNSNMS